MIVIASKVGRLANRLLLFAHFIAAGAEHGFLVVNPAFHPYARYFPSTARDLLCRFPAGRRLPAPPGSRQALYRVAELAADGLHRVQGAGRDVGLIRLRRDQALDLNSREFLDVVDRHRIVFVQDWFFRNRDNCARHRELIRSHFTPAERHLAGARAAVERARQRGSLVVGVHVRRGDYRSFKGGRFFYSHEQYRGILEQVDAAFSADDVAFLVCSDAHVPERSFESMNIVYGNGHQVDDLYALALCDRLVGPPSTYTKWASYYGDVPRYVIKDPSESPGAGSFQVSRGL